MIEASDAKHTFARSNPATRSMILISFISPSLRPKHSPGVTPEPPLMSGLAPKNVRPDYRYSPNTTAYFPGRWPQAIQYFQIHLAVFYHQRYHRLIWGYPVAMAHNLSPIKIAYRLILRFCGTARACVVAPCSAADQSTLTISVTHRNNKPTAL